MAKIDFLSGGYRLRGNLFAAQQPKQLAFLLIQGWTGHQNLEAAQALARVGFTSLTYDMRGNGESDGNIAQFSRTDFASDAATAYDFLKQQVGAQTALGVVGSSFGSYTAVLLSTRRPVACLSLRVPACFPDQGFDEPQLPQLESGVLEAMQNQALSYTENYALQALHNFEGHVQIIEADHDEVVSHQTVENYANAVVDKAKLDHVTLHDAPHRLESDRLKTEYIKLLTDWARHL